MQNRQVSIVTDSTACISPALVEDLEIEIVPVILIFGKESLRDGVDITAGEFYRRLREVEQMPTTSGSLPVPYLEAFQKAGSRAKNIVCITISHKLSGMINSARIARDMAHDTLPQHNIEIIDSGTAAAAQGLIVLAAARAAKAGKSPAEIMGIIQFVMKRVRLFAILDTLEYLVKGGRAPRIAAFATQLLKIKPVLTISNGVAHSVKELVIGQKASHRLKKILEEGKNSGQPLHVQIMHADAEERANQLLYEIEQEFHPVESGITEFTPVMGVHTGPGLLGLAFYYGDLNSLSIQSN